jgi:hypothetical protein
LDVGLTTPPCKKISKKKEGVGERQWRSSPTQRCTAIARRIVKNVLNTA